MGQSSSYPIFPKNETALNLSEQYKEIPYTFNDESQIQILNLSKNCVKTLPSGLKTLLVLVLTYGELNEITPQYIDSIISYTNLETIDLSFNQLKSIPQQILRIPSLKSITAFHNQIVNINLSKCTSQYIDIGHNEITTFPRLSNVIQYLSIDVNRIREIPSSCNWLTKLSVSRNLLKQIDPSISFLRLKTMDLSHNEIESLPNLLSSAPRLRQIDVSYNKLALIPELPLKTQEFYAQNNYLTAFPSNFQVLEKIKIADLSCNMISVIPVLPNGIQTLVIYNNQISKVIKSKATSLRSLYISNNRLKRIPLFMKNVIQDFNMTSNSLESINISIFFHKVSRIDLTDNRISSVPPSLFQLKSLKYLSLTRNNIESIPDDVSESFLLMFNISQNPIKLLPKMPITLEKLIIAHCGLDSLSCYDESNSDLCVINASGNALSWLHLIPSISELYLSRNRFTTIPEPSSKGLKVLDLSFNNIQSMPNVFEFMELRLIDLSYNDIHCLPERILLPKCNRINLSNNLHLSSHLDVKMLPDHVSLDVCSTNIIVINELKQQTIQQSIQYFSQEDISAKTSVKPFNRISDDFQLISLNCKPGRHFFTIFDGKNIEKFGNTLSRQVHRLISSGKRQYDFQEFHHIILKVTEKLKELSQIDPRSFIMCCTDSRELHIATAGPMGYMIIDNNGCIRNRGSSYSKPLQGPLSVQDALGKYIVYGESEMINVQNIEIMNDDKWVILNNEHFSASSHDDLISILSLHHSSPATFAYDLRNLAFSNNPSHTISLIVINVNNMRNNI